MLKEYKSMTQEEMYTLVHEIYIEGCMENAREKYPDATDLTTAIQQEEDSFVCFLQDFFTLPENTYYVLEKDNMPVSAPASTTMPATIPSAAINATIPHVKINS